MNYSEFINAIKRDLPEKLSGTLEGAIVDTAKVNKLQGISYKGIQIIPNHSKIGVILDLEPFFQMFTEGMSYQEALLLVVETANNAYNEKPDFSMDMINDYESIKRNLTVQLVNYEKNEELLSLIPHYNIEDLALVYRINIPGQTTLQSSTLITNHLINHLGITVEQLHQDALTHAAIHEPYEIKNMFEVLRELSGDSFIPDPELPLYVASNSSRINGASVLLYPDFFKKASECIGDSFYILPSSIHELILVSSKNIYSIDDLQTMVRDINDTQVRPEEKLSDNIYHYDIDKQIFKKVTE